MKIIDRATRGWTARIFWGSLVVLFVIGLFLARGQKVTALNDQVQQAQSRVESYAKTTIADQAIVDTRAGAISFDKKAFAVAVEGDIFTDPTIARVRVWNKDGLLLASSDPNEVVGELKVAQDATFADALTNKVTQSHVARENFTFATVGSPTTPTDLLEVTTPFMVKDQVDPVGVVQMDVYYATLQAAAESPWSTISLICIIGAVIAGILFVISIVRRPQAADTVVAEWDAGEPASTTSVAGVAVAATESGRDRELEEELTIAREQLHQASEAFAFLEARVQGGPGGQGSSADVEAASSRIAELEAALKRAEREADERVAELERQMQEGAAKVDPEMKALRARLAEAESRAKRAEGGLVTTGPDGAAAREAIGAAPNGEARGDQIAEHDGVVAVANGEVGEDAEEDETAPPLTSDENDLRARLARAAARKRLGPSG